MIGTKSGEKKNYEPKWESCKNVGTKKSFIPLNFNNMVYDLVLNHFTI